MGALMMFGLVILIANVGGSIALWDERMEKRRKKEAADKKVREEELLARRMEKQRSMTDVPKYY